MDGKRMGAWACALMVGLCAVFGRAEEVSDTLELTADTVLTNLTGSGTITCSAAQPVTLTLHSTEQTEFTGIIDGNIRVVKTGTGQLRLMSRTVSSFSGGLEIEAGTYSQIAAVGSGPITVRGNGGLVFQVGGTLTNRLTFAESGKLGVWRNFTLTLKEMPDMRKVKVTFTDGGIFYFPEPLTDAVAGGTVFAVDKGILSLPENVFGMGDGLLVSSLSLTAGSLLGGASGGVQGYLSRLHARGTVTLPDLSLAGGRQPLTCEIPVEIADTTQGDPRTLAPPPAFVFGGRVAVTADTVIDGVTVGVTPGTTPTEVFVAADKTLALSNAVLQVAGAAPGGLQKTGAGTLAFHDVLDVEDRVNVLEGTAVFGGGVQTVAPATLGLADPATVLRFEDGAVADVRLGSTTGVHTGFLATAGIWFDAAATLYRDGTTVSTVPNFGAAGGVFSTAFAFGKQGAAPTFSATGLAGKPALAFNGKQSLALSSYTNTSDQITVFTVLQCDAYYPSADGRGLWVGFFSTCTPNAAYLEKYGEDQEDPGSLYTSFDQKLDETYDTVEKTFSRLSVRQGFNTLYTFDAQGQLPLGAPFLFAHRSEGASHTGSLYWGEAADEVTAGGTAGTHHAFTARIFSLGGRLTGAGQPNTGRMFTGKIGELLVFDRALTPSETAFVKAYLKNKWFGTELDAALETDAEPSVPQRHVTLDVPEGTAHVALAKTDDDQDLLLEKTGAGSLGFSDAGGAARRLAVQEGELALRPSEAGISSGKAVIWLDADDPGSMTLDETGAVVAARNLGTAGGSFTLSTVQGGVPYLTDGSGINGRNTLAFNGRSALGLASYTNNSEKARDLHLYAVFQRNGMKVQFGGPISFSCATDTGSDHLVRGNFHIEDATATTVKLFFGTTGAGSAELYALEGENPFVDGEPFLFVSHQGTAWTANAFIRQSLDDLSATPWFAQSGQRLTAPRITLCQLGGRLKGGIPQDGRDGTDQRLWAGWLGEFIVFDRALQEVEEVQLLGYLRRKWLGKGEGSETPPACLRNTPAAGRTHGGLDLALGSGTALRMGVANQPLASLALDGVAVTSELEGEAGRGPLFTLAGGAGLAGALSFGTDRFPVGGVTFFTYGTAVSGTPSWTLAGERGALMRARDEKSARRYVFAAPGGSVILVR